MSHRKRKGERRYGRTCQNLRPVRNYGLFCGCRNQYCQRSAGFRYYRHGKHGGTGSCGKNPGRAGEFGVSVSIGKSHGESRAGRHSEGRRLLRSRNCGGNPAVRQLCRRADGRLCVYWRAFPGRISAACPRRFTHDAGSRAARYCKMHRASGKCG